MFFGRIATREKLPFPYRLGLWYTSSAHRRLCVICQNKEMDSLPNQLGYLLLDEDGAVIASNGDLENDERIGSIIVKMLRAAQKQELGLGDANDGFQRMTINYPDHCYIVCVSNKRIHIAKRLVSPSSEVIA